MHPATHAVSVHGVVGRHRVDISTSHLAQAGGLVDGCQFGYRCIRRRLSNPSSDSPKTPSAATRWPGGKPWLTGRASWRPVVLCEWTVFRSSMEIHRAIDRRMVAGDFLHAYADLPASLITATLKHVPETKKPGEMSWLFSVAELPEYSIIRLRRAQIRFVPVGPAVPPRPSAHCRQSENPS